MTNETTMAGETREEPAADVETGERAGMHLEREVEGGTVRLRQSIVGVVRGEHVEISAGGAGLVFADDDIHLERGGARSMVAGERLSISQGGAGMILVGGDASISQGGAGTLLSLGDVRIERGGAGAVVAPTIRVEGGGFVGVALGQRIELGEGARVLAGPREAGMIAGAALLAMIALVLNLLRR